VHAPTITSPKIPNLPSHSFLPLPPPHALSPLLAMQEFAAALPQPKAKLLPFAWPLTLNLADLNPIPRKYRPSRKTRMRLSKIKSKDDTPAAGADDVTKLQTSFNALHSMRALRRRQWSIYDLQYLVVFGYILFSLFILPSAPLVKTGAMVVLGILLLMPITRQFFLPSLPIWTYLLYFFSSR